MDASEERRQEIIEAAFRVFSQKGYRGATNREIAAEADITPGLIYWYFDDKEDLFMAVVRDKSALITLDRLGDELEQAPPRVFFSSVARAMLDMSESERLVATIRLLLSEALRSPSVRRLLTGRIISRGLEIIAAYLRNQIERGRIKEVNPELAARLFMGMLMAQVLVGRLLELKPPKPLEESVDDLVDTYLFGLMRTDEAPDSAGG